jgi:hypothetical protein
VRRDGTGVADQRTGTTSVNAIPLVTKGRAEETVTGDMNYFLGIDAATSAARRGPERRSRNDPGANHPLVGSTALQTSICSRGGHTDGSVLRLFLNGSLNGSLAVVSAAGRPSIQRCDRQRAELDRRRGRLLQRRDRRGPRVELRAVVGAAHEAASRGFREPAGCCWPLGARQHRHERRGQLRHVNGTITGSNFSWVSGGPFNGALNAAPSVNRQPAVPVTLPARARSAVRSPTTASPAPVTVLWTSGPGLVIFGNATSASTSVDFSATGSCVLTPRRDGELSASDSITLAVGGIANQAPTVDVGADQTITLPVHSVSVSGIVSDDGLPGGPITTLWTKVSGPGSVTFGNTSAAATSASFSQNGTYVLQLAANDGVLTGFDTRPSSSAPIRRTKRCRWAVQRLCDVRRVAVARHRSSRSRPGSGVTARASAPSPGRAA